MAVILAAAFWGSRVWAAPADQAAFDRLMGSGVEDFLTSSGAGRSRMPIRDSLAAAVRAPRSSVDALAAVVASVLPPDSLKKPWRGAGDNPMAGRCYVASEALYHLIGGKSAGWTPMVVRHEGTTHWFLRHESGKIVDITASQFKTPVPYGLARGCGFFTREPSGRAAEVIRRVTALLAGRDWRDERSDKLD